MPGRGNPLKSNALQPYCRKGSRASVEKFFGIRIFFLAESQRWVYFFIRQPQRTMTAADSIIIASSKNCPSSTVFEIVRETEKAYQLKNMDIAAKHAFPVWVPKSAIGCETIEINDYAGHVKVDRLFFKSSVERMMDKPWKRVALGLSCY